MKTEELKTQPQRETKPPVEGHSKRMLELALKKQDVLAGNIVASSTCEEAVIEMEKHLVAALEMNAYSTFSHLLEYWTEGINELLTLLPPDNRHITVTRMLYLLDAIPVGEPVRGKVMAHLVGVLVDSGHVSDWESYLFTLITHPDRQDPETLEKAIRQTCGSILSRRAYELLEFFVTHPGLQAKKVKCAKIRKFSEEMSYFLLTRVVRERVNEVNGLHIASQIMKVTGGGRYASPVFKTVAEESQRFVQLQNDAAHLEVKFRGCLYGQVKCVVTTHHIWLVVTATYDGVQNATDPAKYVQEIRGRLDDIVTRYIGNWWRTTESREDVYVTITDPAEIVLNGATTSGAGTWYKKVFLRALIDDFTVYDPNGPKSPH